VSEFRAGEAGFTLLEMVCVFALLGLTAAILLPRLPRETSRSRLEAYAIETASLLKSDRTTAIRRRSEIATKIDASAREARSGSTGRTVHIPDDVVFDSVLPRHCNQRAVVSTINFFPNGMSCGGVITLTRFGTGFEIRVNWLTGNVEIVSHTST
jgi:general secretion pathway protein H